MWKGGGPGFEVESILGWPKPFLCHSFDPTNVRVPISLAISIPCKHMFEKYNSMYMYVYYIILYCIRLYSKLHYIILYYIVLYYIISYYIVLYIK